MRLSVGDTKFGLLQNGQLPQSRVQKQTGALCFGELFRKQSLSTHAWSLVTEWCLRHNHLSCLGGVVQGLDGAGGGVIGSDAGGHCDCSLRKSYLLNCRTEPGQVTLTCFSKMPTTDFLKKKRIVVFSRCVVLFLLDVSFPYLDTRKANPPSFFNTLRTNSVSIIGNEYDCEIYDNPYRMNSPSSMPITP